jgi:23S rRNA pseudouridine1911/1915/1917 synthase
MRRNNINMSKIPEILFEDNHLLIVNKGVSDIVQEDKTGDESLEELIKAYIKERDQKPGNVFLGVAHRIDRPVSGVVVFAKTSKALARMNEMFQSREIQKIYWAIVKERPKEDEALLEHFISRNTQKNKAFIHTKEVKDSKRASLHYKLKGKSDNYYLLEIELHTGRHHQIRAQLAFIGCPIKGDLKYGYARSNKNGGISLHSRSIRFIHPVKKEEIFVEAPVPESDLYKVFM